MGRKIPKSTRHKKLKSIDPFYRGKRRELLDRGASKSNQKPSDPDVQEVPRRLRELMSSQALLRETETNNSNKKRAKKSKDEERLQEFDQIYKNEEDRVEGMPIFQRLPGESDYDLLMRINRITQSVIEESRMEAKFDNRTDRQILDDAEKSAGQSGKESSLLNIQQKLISEVRRKKRQDFEEKKKEKKRLKLEENKDDFDHLKDNVKFGEVTLEPPSLSSTPQGTQSDASTTNAPSAHAVRKFKYTEEQMNNALKDVSTGTRVATAAKRHGVPRVTLLNKFKGKYPLERRMGPNPVLTKEEENIIVVWIYSVSKSGFPVTRDQLLDSVQQLIKQLERKNSFTDGRPGKSWYSAFMRRNPTISSKLTEKLTISRAKITTESLTRWYSEMYEYLDTSGYLTILLTPGRVFNVDESAFFLNPKVGLGVFYNFLANMFHPWLVEKKVELPVLLFIDGRTSHITLEANQFCEEHKIILVALHPNATNLFESTDESVFRSLKPSWKENVHQWRLSYKDDTTLRRKDNELNSQEGETDGSPEVNKNGFRKFSLFPPKNQEAINLAKEKSEKEMAKKLEQIKLYEYKIVARVLEDHISSEKLSLFKQQKGAYNGKTEDVSLYEFWKMIKTACNVTEGGTALAETHEKPDDDDSDVIEEIMRESGGEYMAVGVTAEMANQSSNLTIDQNNGDQNNDEEEIYGVGEPSTSNVAAGNMTNVLDTIPSPFQAALIWGSVEWRNSYLKKEQMKKGSEEAKKIKQKRKKLEERIGKRKQKTDGNSRNKKRSKKPGATDESSTDEDEWQSSESSEDDEEIDLDNDTAWWKRLATEENVQFENYWLPNEN